MARLRLRPALSVLALALATVAAACGVDDTGGALHVVTIDRAVDRVLERYIDRAIDHAEDNDARAVLLRIDTPGGEIGAMKEIVGRIERAEVPVITYVGPPGAAAASAGTFIAMAGHVAAVAPNTTIGAATPITGTGEDIDGALGRKVTNDTVAFARGVAELRGRNADWAESAVRDAISATPDEAVELNVVDLLAATEQELLAAVEGREVTLLDGSAVTLRVVGAPRVVNDLNLYERVLGIVSDPLIVSLLFLIGIIGIATELFFAPGSFVPGTVGAIALLLSFLGVGTLLPGETAVALVVLAIVLVVLEFFIPTGGVLAAAAAVALALAIGIGQSSTEVSFVRILLVLVATIGAVVLVFGAIFAVFARKYMAETTARPEQEPGAEA